MQAGVNRKCGCVHCSMEFPSYAEYFNHVRLRHSRGGRCRVKCPLPSCMYVFSNTRYFYRHLQTPHENRADRVEAPQEVNEKLRCSHCKDDFEGIVRFAKRVKAVLKNWDKTLQGEITVKCPAKYRRNRKEK